MRRGGAVRGVEQQVARREGQAVLATDDGTLDDFERQPQLTHHRLDDGDLLEILLAEVGAGRPHDVEQAADHLRHAVEVARTRGALHHLVHRTEVELPRIGLGIDLLHRRHQHVVGTGLLQQPGVGLGCAGIAHQVVLVVELRRVHEDAHHDRGVLRAGPLHQRAVSCVQGAHRRHEPDARRIAPVECAPQLFDRMEYFHCFQLSKQRGKFRN